MIAIIRIIIVDRFERKKRKYKTKGEVRKEEEEWIDYFDCYIEPINNTHRLDLILTKNCMNMTWFCMIQILKSQWINNKISAMYTSVQRALCNACQLCIFMCPTNQFNKRIHPSIHAISTDCTKCHLIIFFVPYLSWEPLS